MLKQVIAQLKQSPELLSQLQQGRLSFAGVSPEEHRALAEVMKAQSGEPRKNAKFWM
ncbi:competence pheromone ComX [Paenibacillus sp. SYP-B4298]|uniref:competence pheromone ComX n=1 Tax=Paenibacillus sp. SYP-B4298 TaxID=2996034 RepID=UPI0022DDB4C4|nr:competence pheromone ComX [Paenibacillus sp. SYP-B4298]